LRPNRKQYKVTNFEDLVTLLDLVIGILFGLFSATLEGDEFAEGVGKTRRRSPSGESRD
jgi:hypothetical protein